MFNRRAVVGAAGSIAGLTALAPPLTALAKSPGAQATISTSTTDETLRVDVDLRAPTGPLNHIWEESIGSDRAGITLREDWRISARRAHQELGVKRVRFHGIFNDDEMGVGPAQQLGPNAAQFNFQNIDAVYDGILEIGLTPFIELSFMPGRLASGTSQFGVYRGNTSPPKSLEAWQAFIQLFIRHLQDRYGADVVRQWYFEVWNEPDLAFFWTGTKAQYFDLYVATATAIKAIDPAIKVGGPSTSKVQWLPEFFAHCAESGAPVDFVSTHVYAGDNQQTVFGQAGLYKQNDVIPAAMRLARQRIDEGPFPHAELWLSEWSSDSPAMMAHIIQGCLPLCHGMSFWQVGAPYEEVLVPNHIIKEGDNSWGIMAARNIPRPSFNTFKLLARLGDTAVQASGPAIASRTAEGHGAILVWNLAEATQPAGIPGASSERHVVGSARQVAVTIAGARPGQRVKVSYVDMARGSPFPAWRAMGSPQYPTRDQLAKLRAAAELPAPETRRLGRHLDLTLDLPPEGVALIELA